MRTLWPLAFLAALLVSAAACYDPADTFVKAPPTPAPTPTPVPFPKREILAVDVTSCIPGTVSGPWNVTVEHISVQGVSGDSCLFDMVSEVSPATRFSCQVPRSLGTISIYEFDQGIRPAVYGYRYGLEYSWDLDFCTLTECGPGVVFPESCARD